MTIKAGDRLPSMKITLAGADGPEDSSTDALFGGHKAVLFAVPGAFTPTCSERHLPSYLEQFDALGAKGVNPIVCLAVNDVFVLRAWAAQTGAAGKLVMLADGSAQLTHALGLELDLTGRGLGVRAQRFAMVIDDMVVTTLAIEPPGGYGVSSAEQVLATL
jgi:peroxiredoxin (alkyl hydroperoxide reductase subunit C)